MARQMALLIAGKHAGKLVKRPGFGVEFTYETTYDGPPLSVHMPIDDQPYTGIRTENWFKGLLPGSEEVLRGMAEACGTDPRDTFDLVAHYGLDLPGAVQICEEERMQDVLDERGSYRLITDHDIGEVLREIVRHEHEGKAHVWAREDEHWSLSGNQGKITLRLSETGQWLRCVGSAPSTHIVKPGVSWLSRQALVEALCMRAATYVGITTSAVDVIDFDGVQAICIERYDRAEGKGGLVRLHQEDLCQALGADPDRKYADEGGPNALDCVEVIASFCPERDVWRFAECLLYNHLISGTDAHCKNYSLVFGNDTLIRLAPLYDVASNATYVARDRYAPYRTAMSVGGENQIGRLRESNIRKCARQFGLDAEVLIERTYEMCDAVPRAFDKAACDFSHAEGIDRTASVLVPRIKSLCEEVAANITHPVYGAVSPSYLHLVDEDYGIGSLCRHGGARH